MQLKVDFPDGCLASEKFAFHYSSFPCHFASGKDWRVSNRGFCSAILQHLNQIVFIWAPQGHWGVPRAVVLRTHDTAFKIKAILDALGKKNPKLSRHLQFNSIGSTSSALGLSFIWALRKHKDGHRQLSPPQLLWKNNYTCTKSEKCPG